MQSKQQRINIMKGTAFSPGAVLPKNGGSNELIRHGDFISNYGCRGLHK